MRGGKREARRAAAELEVGPGRSTPAGRQVGDVLDAWVEQNVATMARLRSTKTAPRGVMSTADVQAVMAAAEAIDPAAVLALRLAAVSGARRAELAAMRWNDLWGSELTIDSAIELIRHEAGERELRNPAVTLRVYAHAFAAADQAVAAGIGGLLRSTTPPSSEA